VKSFFLTIGAIISAQFTGWLCTILVVSLFCDGYQPNWLCSGHGGAWVVVAVSAIVLSLPIYLYFYVFKGRAQNHAQN